MSVCSVKIESVQVSPPLVGSGAILTVTVAGKADNCSGDVVVVEIACKQTSSEPVKVTSGRWCASFTNLKTAECACGEPLVVRAYCEKDPSCVDQTAIQLDCPPPPSTTCPTVVVTATPGDCQGGQRKVTFHVIVGDGTGAVVTQLVFGMDPHGTPLVGPARTETTYDQDWWYTPPGPGTVKLATLVPPNCPDQEFPVPQLDSCPSEPPLCPDLALDLEIGGCQPNGKRAVALHARVTNAAAGSRIQLDYGDGEPGTPSLSEERTVTGDTREDFQHDYKPGASYTATLQVTTASCPTVTAQVGPVGACLDWLCWLLETWMIVFFLVAVAAIECGLVAWTQTGMVGLVPQLLKLAASGSLFGAAGSVAGAVGSAAAGAATAAPTGGAGAAAGGAGAGAGSVGAGTLGTLSATLLNIIVVLEAVRVAAYILCGVVGLVALLFFTVFLIWFTLRCKPEPCRLAQDFAWLWAWAGALIAAIQTLANIGPLAGLIAALGIPGLVPAVGWSLAPLFAFSGIVVAFWMAWYRCIPLNPFRWPPNR